jgi:hypothetical protein
MFLINFFFFAVELEQLVRNLGGQVVARVNDFEQSKFLRHNKVILMEGSDFDQQAAQRGLLEMLIFLQ